MLIFVSTVVVDNENLSKIVSYSIDVHFALLPYILCVCLSLVLECADTVDQIHCESNPLSNHRCLWISCVILCTD